MKNSPYLRDNNRLADVIAAIQVMATYKYYKLDCAGWANRINGDETKAEYWKQVFEEHQEFFRLGPNRNKASLVLRRQHQKRYNVDTAKTISRKEYDDLSEDELKRISRTPLGSDELATLVKTAIDLHARALEQKRDTRWWVSGMIGLLGVVIGALVTVLTR